LLDNSRSFLPITCPRRLHKSRTIKAIFFSLMLFSHLVQIPFVTLHVRLAFPFLSVVILVILVSQPFFLPVYSSCGMCQSCYPQKKELPSKEFSAFKIDDQSSPPFFPSVIMHQQGRAVYSKGAEGGKLCLLG